MIDGAEWDWIVEHSSGAFDHIVIASTLPVFLRQASITSRHGTRRRARVAGDGSRRT